VLLSCPVRVRTCGPTFDSGDAEANPTGREHDADDDCFPVRHDPTGEDAAFADVAARARDLAERA
jgi:hypothetical protein